MAALGEVPEIIWKETILKVGAPGQEKTIGRSRWESPAGVGGRDYTLPCVLHNYIVAVKEKKSESGKMNNENSNKNAVGDMCLMR